MATASVKMTLPVVKGPGGKTYEFFEGMKQHFTDLYEEWVKSDYDGTIMCPPFFARGYISPIGDVPGAAPLNMVLGIIKGDDAEKKIFDVLKQFGEKTKQPMFVLSKLTFTKFNMYCFQQKPDEKPIPFHVEFDFVIVHLNIGVILIEVKAADKWPDKMAFHQLQRGERAIKGLLQEESGIPVYKVIALPNMDGYGYCKDDFFCLQKSDVDSCDKFSRWMKAHFNADKCGSQEKQELLTLLYKLVLLRTKVSSSLNTKRLYQVRPDEVLSECYKMISSQLCLKKSFLSQKIRPKKRKADGSESCFGLHQAVVKTTDRVGLVRLARQVMFLNPEQLRVWEGPRHQLISGAPGSGKTILLQCRALECARRGEKVIICVPVHLRNLYDDFFMRIQKNKEVISSRVKIYTFAELCKQSELLPVNEEKFHLFVDELQIPCAHDATKRAYLNELMRRQKDPKTCYCWFAYDDSQFMTSRTTPHVSSTGEGSKLPTDDQGEASHLSKSYYFAMTNSNIEQLVRLAQTHQFFVPSRLKTVMRSTEQTFEFVNEYADKTGVYSQIIKSKQLYHNSDFSHAVTALKEDWQVKIGHRICGPPVEVETASLESVLGRIYTEISMCSSLKQIAVLATDDFILGDLSAMCKHYRIPICAVGENEEAVVVDHGGKAHSYEWPVVIAVCGTKSDNFISYLLFSRAVSKLVVFNVQENLQDVDNESKLLLEYLEIKEEILKKIFCNSNSQHLMHIWQLRNKNASEITGHFEDKLLNAKLFLLEISGSDLLRNSFVLDLNECDSKLVKYVELKGAMLKIIFGKTGSDQ